MIVERMARFLGLAVVAMTAVTCAGRQDPAESDEAAPPERTGEVGEASASANSKTFGIWDPGKPTPSSLSARRGFAAAGVVTGFNTVQVLLTGGEANPGGSNAYALPDVWRYDPAAGWFAGANMIVARHDHSICALGGSSGGTVLVAGGSPAAAATSAEIYTVASNTWQQLPAMPQGRQHPVVTKVPMAGTGGEPTARVLVLGGVVASPNADLWNGTTWVTTQMTAARDDATATAVGAGRVLVVGGNDTTQAEMYSYLGGTDLWDAAAGGALAASRRGHTAACLLDGDAPATATSQCKVLVAGGAGPDGKALASVEIWDPTFAGHWRRAAPMNVARTHHTMTALQTGDVVVTGGTGADGQATTTTEIYDPIGDIWTLVEPMGKRRAHHAATTFSADPVHHPIDSILVLGDTVTPGAADDVAVFRTPAKFCETIQGKLVAGVGVTDHTDTATTGKLLVNASSNSALAFTLPKDGRWARRVTSAMVTLDAYSVETAAPIDVYRVTGPWSAGLGPTSWDETTKVSTFTPTGPGLVSFTVAPIAQGWFDAVTDYGVVLESDLAAAPYARATFYATSYPGTTPPPATALPSLQICFYALPPSDACEGTPTCLDVQCSSSKHQCATTPANPDRLGHCDYPPLTGAVCADGCFNRCVAGKCAFSTPDVCDDHEACTKDTCDPSTRTCVRQNLDYQNCDHPLECTVGKYCLNGTCGHGSAVNCNDDNLCTDNVCVAGSGCVTTDVSATKCNSHDWCIADSCSPAVGCQSSKKTVEPCNGQCSGETYDVDGDPSNGCEVTDSGGHVITAATDHGSQSCDDGVAVNITGVIPSDHRLHPSTTGFDGFAGAAPDFHKIHATGGHWTPLGCWNDVQLTFSVTSSNPSCYMMAVSTTAWPSLFHWSCTPSAGATSCQVNDPQVGLHYSYDDNSDIYVGVVKTCSTATLTEDMSYTISGHL
jgi:hypothetical protein